MNIQLTIEGNPRTKKNSMQFIRLKSGKTALVQSKLYAAYKQTFVLQAKNAYKSDPIGEAINIKCLYYRGDRRRVDLVNLQNATLDLLIEAGILKDDNSNIVVSMDGSRVYFDKENPRVEIYITSFNNNNDNKEDE